VSARNPDSNMENHVKLSSIGAIVERQWNDILNQYDGVELDKYVIMPNHMHGIIVINHTKKRADARPAPTVRRTLCSR
jgi:putative transposase